jgi:hypothetical protein
MNALKRVKNDLEVSTGSREDNHNKTLLLKVVGKKSRSSAAGSRFSRPYSSSSLKKSRPKVFPALPPAFEERLANWKEDIEAAKKQEESERKNSSDWLNANLVLKRVLCKPLGDEIALSANMVCFMVALLTEYAILYYLR